LPEPLPEPGSRLELERPRDLGALLADTLVLTRRHLWKFLAIGFAVVVPVNAVVLGVGLGQFSGGYDSTPPPASGLVPALVSLLVVDPLVAAMALHVLQAAAAGRPVRVGAAIQAGLDAFARVFWPVLMAVLCEAATLITVVVPFVLLVRWFFVPQVVVVDGARGGGALRASWELTRGFGLRTAGLVLVARLLFLIAGALVATPVAALARSANSEALSLAATTLGYVLVVTPLGVFAGLLFYDLRSRQAALAR
jgi:hypothetical protein